MERDWFDSYLDALGDPGYTQYFPPDAPANQKGAKQRLLFDAVASSEEEQRSLFDARMELENHGGENPSGENPGGNGDNAWELSYRYLYVTPTTTSFSWYSGINFNGTNGVTQSTFTRVNPQLVRGIRTSLVLSDICNNMHLYTNLQYVNFSNQSDTFTHRALDNRLNIITAILTPNLLSTNFQALNNNSSLTTLILDNNTGLKSLIIQNAPKLASGLTFVNCTALTYIDLTNCGIAADLGFNNNGPFNSVTTTILDQNPGWFNVVFNSFIPNNVNLSWKNGGRNITAIDLAYGSNDTPLQVADFTGSLSACTSFTVNSRNLVNAYLGNLGVGAKADVTISNAIQSTLKIVDFSGAKAVRYNGSNHFGSVSINYNNLPSLDLSDLTITTLNLDQSLGLSLLNIDRCSFNTFNFDSSYGSNNGLPINTVFNNVSCTGTFAATNNKSNKDLTFNSCYIQYPYIAGNSSLSSVTINNPLYTNSVGDFSSNVLTQFSINGGVTTPFTSLNLSNNKFTTFNFASRNWGSSLTLASNSISSIDLAGSSGGTLSLNSNPLNTLTNSGTGSYYTGIIYLQYMTGKLSSFNSSTLKLSAGTYNFYNTPSITNIDISRDPVWQGFNASSMIALSALTFSTTHSVQTFNVDTITPLRTLNLSGLSASNYTIVNNNPSLTALDISNTKVNQLSINNNASLQSINTNAAMLTGSISVQANPSLTAFSFSTAPTTITQVDIAANTAITTLNVSGLSASTYINIQSNTSLSSLNIDNVVTGSLIISNNPKLSSFGFNYINVNGGFDCTSNSLSGFTGYPTGTITSELNLGYNKPILTVANLSAMSVGTLRCNTTLTSLSVGNFTAPTVALANTGLTSISMGTSAFKNCTYLDLINNNLTSTGLSSVLTKLNANGLSNGTVTFNGGTNALSSTAATPALALIGKGWKVIDETYNTVVNPGFETGDFTGWMNDNGVFAVTNDLPHTGTYSVVFDGSSYDNLYSDQMFIPQNAVLTFWMYVISYDPGAIGYVGFQNGNNVDISNYLRNNTSGWIQLSVNSGESGTYDNIIVYVDDSDNAEGLTVYFDDFKITYGSI